MPFKWVQCMVCARTGHINNFPEPEHRRLKKTGYGVCKDCSGFALTQILESSPLEKFFNFVEVTSETRR